VILSFFNALLLFSDESDDGDDSDQHDSNSKKGNFLIDLFMNVCKESYVSSL
jgi:hypothetical protein